MLPDKTSVALNREAIVIVACTDTADDACFFVDSALIVVVLYCLVILVGGI